MACILRRTPRTRCRDARTTCGKIERNPPDENPNASALHRKHRTPIAPNRNTTNDALTSDSLVSSTSPAQSIEEPSRGKWLLLEGRKFHVAVRGLQDTSGFRYISSLPKRDARFLEGLALRRWELQTEHRLDQAMCLWKLNIRGAINVIITPEALFNDGGFQQRENPDISYGYNFIRDSAFAHGKEEQAVVSVSRGTSMYDGGNLKQFRVRGNCRISRQPVSHRGKVQSNISYVQREFAQEKTSNPGSIDNGKAKRTFDRCFGHRPVASSGYLRPRLEEPPLVPLAWGWGEEYRLGTGSDRLEAWPRHLHPNFQGRRLIDLATGKRHTLFVTDTGLVLSVGEGLSWQLGTISTFTAYSVPRTVQRLPKQVQPSGHLKAGKDYQVVQAAAGDTFSITREANGEDAAQAVEGFLWMKKSVKMLVEQSTSFSTLSELWGHILEEERTLHRRFQGRLMAWGTGKRGELGLGAGVQERRTPVLIRALYGESVRAVVAGASHVLCATLDGKIYSWGSGRDGRLGHGDYKDRWEPCRVRELRTENIALVATGTAHSMAVSLPHSIYVWGRGTHGRLGIGDNRCRYIPVRLKSLPASFRNYTVKGLALGGAHSVILAHRSVPVTLANPWGTESVAYAWGYGLCGQLGLGQNVGEVKKPRKVAFDRKDLIVSIAAGKSYSLATSIQGQVFSWGQGWAGQLGTGKSRDARVTPAKISFPGDARHLFVRVAAGERHASALALRCSAPPRGWNVDKQWGKVTRSHVGMKNWESSLLRKWRCPRRPPWTGPGLNPEPLYSCATCGMSCVCRKCARYCHQGHDVQACLRTLRVLCECGLRPREWDGGKGGDYSALERGSSEMRQMRLRDVRSVCRLLAVVEDEDTGKAGAWLEKNAVECQRVIRGWFVRRVARQRQKARQRLRRLAMEAFWHVNVLGAIERSITRFGKGKEQERDRESMAAADAESRFYRYYSKLQRAIQALNQQRKIIRELSAREGVKFKLPTLGANLLAPRRGFGKHRTFTVWSRRSARQLQRQLPPSLRLDEVRLVEMTAALPAGDRSPTWSCGLKGGDEVIGLLGEVSDPDVDALIRSSQPYRKRRTVDLAGPERLYQRITRMRRGQILRLSSRRRGSFTEGDYTARVDKQRTTEDLKWALQLSRYWEGVDSSLGATRYLQIRQTKFDKLTDTKKLRWRRGLRSIHKFLRSFGPGSVDPDVAAVKEKQGSSRAHSLCAPERLYAARMTWESRHGKVEALLQVAAKKGLPTWGDSMKWTTRAQKWGGLVPNLERNTISIANLRSFSQLVEIRAEKLGWDLPHATDLQKTGSDGEIKGMGSVGSANGFGPKASSSPYWTPEQDEHGNTYFINYLTGESAWEIPQITYEQDSVWDQTGEGYGASATGVDGESIAWWGDGTGGDSSW